MKRPTRRILASLALACAAHPGAGLACAIVAPEDQPRLRLERIERTKAQAAALRDEADLVFIGKMTQLSFQRETVKNEEGREIVLQKHLASFDFVDNIKGSYAKGQTLEYTVNKNRVTISCEAIFRDNLPGENGAGERYLVYARNGQILRTSHIPWHPQVLGAYQEAAHLRGQ